LRGINEPASGERGAMNPDRYYRVRRANDSLKKLGGFAATLKLVMTMQWVPARRQPEWQARLRTRTFLWTLALWVALSVTAPWTALAATHPLRTRTRPVARPIGLSHIDHVRTSGRAARPLAKRSAKRESRQTMSSRSARGETVAARSKTRNRTQAREESRPVRSLRVKAEMRRGHDVSKRGARNVGARRGPAERVATPAADKPRPLTVDDFLKAADASPVGGSEVGAQGQSHPEEKVSVVVLRSPVKQPIAVQRSNPRQSALVERAESNRATVLSDLTRSAPSDLAGAPLETEQRSPTHRIASAPRAELPAGRWAAPTRQELTEAVEQPVVLPGLYRNGRLVMPAPLKGTHEILVHQNTMADDEGLQRIQDDDDLRRLRAAHLLVDFPETAGLHINPELAANRRCARLWTVRFAAEIGQAYYARFHEPLQLNSAVRTVAYQLRLQRTNGNAAAINGEAASPHLTGQAMDLGKRGMTLAQIAWMRAYLLPMMQAGKIDVEEEFQQACFHISVYRAYLPGNPTRRRGTPRAEEAQLRNEPAMEKAPPPVEELH
jgi:hypothetical protein